jgi:hypothetical protein
MKHLLLTTIATRRKLQFQELWALDKYIAIIINKAKLWASSNENTLFRLQSTLGDT